MDTGPISSATVMDSTQYTTSISAAETPVTLSSTSNVDPAATASTDSSASPSPVTSSSTSDVDQASATASPGPSTSASPAAPVLASPSDPSGPSVGSVLTAQSAFPTVAGTYTNSIPASVPTTMIIVTSMVSSPWVTMSTYMTIPTTTMTLPMTAKPHVTADSQHRVSYQKQHEKQVIGGSIGGAFAVFLVMGLLLWLFLYLRRNWMRCKRRCQTCKLRRTDSNDSKRSGDSTGAEGCLKFNPKKVSFTGMCLSRCCRPRIAEGDDCVQELETRDPTGPPRISDMPHRQPARYASFFGHSGNQDFQTPTSQKSRLEKRVSRHKTLKVSNPDPSAPVPSDSGSSASENAAAASGFVAGPEYDAGEPDAIHTINNEDSAGMTSMQSLESDRATKDPEFQPSPTKRRSLSPLKPAVLSKSDSRPKPKKSILKKHRKDSPDFPVEPVSESREKGEASNASPSGEGASKPPTDKLKFSFEDLASEESRLKFPEKVSPTAEMGMIDLKNLTSAVRGSADYKQGMSKDHKGSEAGQESIAEDDEQPKSAIGSEARWGGLGDTERQTEHPPDCGDCTENASPSEQAGSLS